MRIVLLVFLFLYFIPTLAQHNESFIYGKVTTADNKNYSGCIRWNKEEVFWQDFFNSVKTENKYHSYVSKEDILENIRMWFSNEKKKKSEDSEGKSSEEESPAEVEKDLSHVWVCAFGDLRSIVARGGEITDLELKDGTIVQVKGGSNDIGTPIKVLDSDLGELTLDWNKITKIEFIKTPAKLSRTFGAPLFGTVNTSSGSFEGFIQWDQEERLATDFLDANTEDCMISLEFASIKSISKQGAGSWVKLCSGREIFLTGTNDVNDENRGININAKNIGRITVPWKSFISVEFSENPDYSQPDYDDFSKPAKIKGEVVSTNGNAYKGTIAYDLDEEYEFEYIQGNDNGVEYAIPAKNISRITPEETESRITLKNGKTVLIGGTHDVAQYNSGLLIFSKANEQPVYLKWSEIKEINLQ